MADHRPTNSTIHQQLTNLTQEIAETREVLLKAIGDLADQQKKTWPSPTNSAGYPSALRH